MFFTPHYIVCRLINVNYVFLSIRTEQPLHILRNIFSCLVRNVIFQWTEINNTQIFPRWVGLTSVTLTLGQGVCSEHNYANSWVICLIVNNKVELWALCLPLPSDRFQCPHAVFSARDGFQACTTGQLHGCPKFSFMCRSLQSFLTSHIWTLRQFCKLGK